MAKATKVTIIELDKARHLKYGINGLIRLEEELGRPLTEMSEAGFTMRDFRAMLFSGLVWEDKKLTTEKVGDLMDIAIEEKGMEYLSEKLEEAMGGIAGQNAMPKK